MIPSLAAYVSLLEPHLVPSLCSPASYAALAELSGRLPAVAVSGFERTLGGRGGSLDLAIAFKRLHSASRHLVHDPAIGAPARALLASASAPGSPLHGAIDVFWLEYDVSQRGDRPSLFVGPRGAERGPVVALASELVLGRPLAPRVRATLERLAAPRAAVVLFQAGWMLGRERPGLRLCFCANEPAALQPLVEHVDDPRQRAAIVACWDRYAAHVTEHVLAVDIGDGEIGPRIGLELGFRGWKPSQPLTRWLPLLLRLRAEGLCTEAEARALLEWPGRMTESSAGDGWPAYLRSARSLLGPYQSRIDRALHHVKLVLERGEITTTKAYFGALQTWGVT